MTREPKYSFLSPPAPPSTPPPKPESKRAEARRLALAHLQAAGPATQYQLAAATGVSRYLLQEALRDLRASGTVAIIGTAPRPGSKFGRQQQAVYGLKEGLA